MVFRKDSLDIKSHAILFFKQICVSKKSAGFIKQILRPGRLHTQFLDSFLQLIIFFGQFLKVLSQVINGALQVGSKPDRRCRATAQFSRPFATSASCLSSGLVTRSGLEILSALAPVSSSGFSSNIGELKLTYLTKYIIGRNQQSYFFFEFQVSSQNDWTSSSHTD